MEIFPALLRLLSLLARSQSRRALVGAVLLLFALGPVAGQTNDPAREQPSAELKTEEAAAPQTWSWHVQNTVIVQYHPGFSAAYSGPNSLSPANEAWDYPGDSLGYITGFAAELNQPQWAVRYGFFQMPRVSNGVALDLNVLKAWGMVTEWEGRYAAGGHPGAVRLLAYLNQAHMGSYEQAVENPARPADIQATRQYRSKYGFGLNVEQEITKNVGVFTRLGWSDGQNEAWVFADVDRTATLGLSLKGELWGRAQDTLGLAGVLNGISGEHRAFLAAGGTGILAGDGRLTYGLEKIIETYYDFQIWRTIHGALDYQFINDPAYNRDRGPVSVLGARLH